MIGNIHSGPACLSLVLLVALVGCGGPSKSVPQADQAALDRFTDAARTWSRQGADPWYQAFKAGNPDALAAVSPGAEARMAGAVDAMSTAAGDLTTPEVRHELDRLVGSYRLKLVAIRRIDAASQAGSVRGVQEGVLELKEAGVAASKAFKAYGASAKRLWGNDPLSDFKLG